MKTMIVGLGNIGFRYTLSQAQDSGIETHYSAINQAGMTVVFGCDLDPNYVYEFEKSTGVTSSTFIKLGKRFQPKVLVVSSSTDSHLEVLEELYSESFNLQVIVLEKPLGKNYEESKRIVELASQISEKTYINYSRQYSRGYKDFKLIAEKLGAPSKIVITYSRDLLTNGSHFLRLALDFIGDNVREEELTVQIIEQNELSPSIICRIGDILLYMIYTNESFRDYSITLFYSEQVIRLFDETIYQPNFGKLDVFKLNGGLSGLYTDVQNAVSSKNELQNEIKKALLVSFIIDQASPRSSKS
jgi:predicted dehydrogenase